jgi:curved DNA-binding protein CbpA
MTLTRNVRKIKKTNIKTRKQYGGSPFINFLNTLNEGKIPRFIPDIDKDIVDFFNSHNKEEELQINTNSTLYQIYNIEPNAPEKEIIKKYRAMSLKFHPDKNKTNSSNERITNIQKDTIIAIKEIYEILKDDEKRIVYNELLNPAKSNNEQRRRNREKSKRKQQKEEQDRIQEEEERLERERVARTQLDQERSVKEQLEQQRLEQERLEQEQNKKMKELNEEIRKQERIKRLDKAEELNKQRLEQKRLKQLEQERLKQLEQERLKQLEQVRLKKEQLEQERLEKEQLEKERLEKERLEKERLASIFSNTLKPQTNIITSPKVIEGLNIYNTVSKYPNVFQSQFKFKGGKKSNNKRNRFKKTKKTRR